MGTAVLQRRAEVITCLQYMRACGTKSGPNGKNALAQLGPMRSTQYSNAAFRHFGVLEPSLDGSGGPVPSTHMPQRMFRSMQILKNVARMDARTA